MSDQDLWRKDLPEGWEGKQSDKEWDGEIPVSPIVWSMVAIALSVIIAFWVNEVIMNDYVEDHVDRVSPIAAAREPQMAVSPMLEVHEKLVYDEFLAASKKRLNGYGWVDQMDHRVHIPVEEAMGMVLAEHGGTERPSAEPPAEPAKDATAPTAASTAADTEAQGEH